MSEWKGPRIELWMEGKRVEGTIIERVSDDLVRVRVPDPVMAEVLHGWAGSGHGPDFSKGRFRSCADGGFEWVAE